MQDNDKKAVGLADAKIKLREDLRCSLHEHGGTPCYGVGTWIWRITLCFTLSAAAATLLHGLGLILTFFGIVLWFGMPAVRLARFLIQGDPTGRPKMLSVAIRVSIAAILIAAVLMLPSPRRTSIGSSRRWDPRSEPACAAAVVCFSTPS